MEHVRHKERCQLPVAETTPVAMRKPDGIDSFLDSHSIKPVQEKRDVIHSFDSLLQDRASPVGYNSFMPHCGEAVQWNL